MIDPNTRIFGPLPEDSLMLKEQCWLYGDHFQAGQRIVLVPVETPDEANSLTVRAKPAHANCKLRGEQVQTPIGARVIERIKDGDANPFPVMTTDGRQWKAEEVGL